MLLQIRYLGVLDTIVIRKSSYPARKPYLNFLNWYKLCDKEFEKKKLDH